MIVLIPAYEPDDRLLALLLALCKAPTTRGWHAVVVDDGSGPAYGPVFASARLLGATVLTHSANRGKGAALRTGFAHLAAIHLDEAVVCADSDGQHTPADIARVGAGITPATNAVPAPDMVLGVRQFTGRVPARSRFGNEVTVRLFAAFTHLPLTDTQTGLRAYPARMLPWLLTVTGDRFDYELRLLLRAAREGLTVTQTPIATVYLAENASSHFRPVVDSWRIYRPFLAYGLSSFAGFLVDAALLAVIMAGTGSLLVSVVGARMVSGVVNFWLNRSVVFADGGRAPLGQTLIRYTALAAVLLAANLTLMSAVVGVGAPLLVAKVFTEVLLFVVGFVVQKVAVFTSQSAARPHEAASVSGPRKPDAIGRQVCR